MFALALAILAAPPSAEAQQPAKFARVGLLTLLPAPHPGNEALRQGLRDLGYVEGQNIVIEYRWGPLDKFPQLAAELVRLKPDVIVAPNPQAAWAVRQATTTIPIVIVVVGDPVGTGLIASFARPGGNITGLSFMAGDLAAKRLELIKETVPGLSRVAVLWNPTVPDKVLEWKDTQAAARVLGLQLLSLEVRTPNDFESAFAAATRWRAGAMIVLPEPLMFSNRARILDFAATNRLPALFAWREFVEAGALIAYGPSIPHNYRRAATFVDKILKGAKPADLPVERPAKFELVINLKTAKALGLTIPSHLLMEADVVLQ